MIAAAAAWLLTGLGAQPAFDVKANYVKRELFIPMRDGVKLFTIVYAPRDTTRRYPLLMTRTAYGIAPYGANEYRTVLGPNNEFAKEGTSSSIRTRAGSSSRRGSSSITCLGFAVTTRTRNQALGSGTGFTACSYFPGWSVRSFCHVKSGSEWYWTA